MPNPIQRGTAKRLGLRQPAPPLLMGPADLRAALGVSAAQAAEGARLFQERLNAMLGGLHG